MNPYFLIITLIGFAAFSMAWMPRIAKKTGVSYAIIYTLVGVIIYTLFPEKLPDPNPLLNETLTLHLTEITVIVSIMGTGIKIDRPFSFKNWASPLKLVLIAMPLCIAAGTLLGITLLQFDLPAALLLAAALAPTDPVLASDVQVDPPNEGLKSETKFSLTAEAGMNDGMAFPFIWLAISLMLVANGQQANLLYWLTYDVIYKIIAGVALGYLSGRTVGYLIFKASKKIQLLKTRDGFVAISLTLIVYGITEMVLGYGFIAVFVCAITLRHFEKKHDYHQDLHAFTNQIERLLIAILLILFGGALVGGILDALTLKMALFTLIFLLFIRPMAAYVSLMTGKFHSHEKHAIAFFGIRGMGSVFYLAFAFHELHFSHEKELWAIVAFTILISILMHGLTATPMMKFLQQEIPEEEVPE